MRSKSELELQHQWFSNSRQANTDDGKVLHLIEPIQTNIFDVDNFFQDLGGGVLFGPGV